MTSLSRLRHPAVLAAVVAVVSLVLVALHLRSDPTTTTDALTVAEPPAVSETTSPAGTPEPTAAPSRTQPPSPAPTARPSAAASELPEDEAASARGETGDGLGPHSPGSVTVPHHAGQHSWSGTSNGMTIRASVSPTSPKAGQELTFTFHASGPEDDCCAIYVVYGDGGVDPDQTECDRPKTGGSASATYRHTYNKAGPHHLLIQAISQHCDDNGVLYATLDVGEGTSTAQGPSRPEARFASSTPVSPNPNNRTVTLWGEGKDRDGHVTQLVVSFGDGTTKAFAGDTNPCQRTRDGWPGPSEAVLPYDPKPYAHTYSSPGTYTLRMTVTSAGCSGKGLQTASATFTWHVGPDPAPEPEPSDTPSPTTG